MTNIFLLISIILNIVALFCIVILYLRQNKLLQVEKKQEQILKDMEEVISSYLMEMTEENEKFLKKVSEFQRKAKAIVPTDMISEKDDNKESQKENTQLVKSDHINFRKGTVFQAVQAYRNTTVQGQDKETTDLEVKDQKALEQESDDMENGTENVYNQSFYYQALLLQKQGLSIEEIAKRLDRGKTEIELLFKLRKNEKE
ncbi:hypothetical protein ABE096_14575 [Robertmurraya massiliosenegalensis]|uniref:hypothetical protein n=1 Tax=Robertmurraya TaxID=2837507 RepID=UPI0039A658B1